MEVFVYRRTAEFAVASLPERKTTEAAGHDVTAYLPEFGESLALEPMKVVKVPTGLYLAGPRHSTILVCSRSGLAAKGIIVVNGPGVIDSDYRGEVMVLLMYVALPGTPPFYINHGDRIAQLLFLPAGAVDVNVSFTTVPTVDDLPTPDSNRVGGFGSTGR